MAHCILLVVFGLQIVLASSHGTDSLTTAGGHCVFPFIYKGVTYRSCTTKNHNRPWCSTTANYDREKMWGNCAGFSSSGVKTTSLQYCTFPFIYNQEVYRSCTTSRHHNRPWCSTTANYNQDRKRGNCAGFTLSSTKTTSGQHCVFPFIYNGVTYRSCTTKNRNRPWCSTTANYDKDKKRGNCYGFYSGVKTTSGERCAFPFVYKGHHYNTCTTKNHNRRWCSTTTNYDKDKKWGNCV